MGRLVDDALIERIRVALLGAGVSQADVAREAGVAPSYISGVLAGRVNPSVRIVLAVERLTGRAVSAMPRPAVLPQHTSTPVEDLQQAMVGLERAVEGLRHPLVELACRLASTGDERIIHQAMGYLEAQVERASADRMSAQSA